MLDPREPKNGDFASYVENLSKLPPGQGMVIGPQAPGSQSDPDASARRHQVKALREALLARKQQALDQVPDGLFGRSGGTPPTGRGASAGPDAPPMQAAIAGLSGIISRIASMLIVLGMVLVGLSMFDELPMRPDTGTGIQVLVIGIFLRMVSQRVLSRKNG